MVQQGDLIVNLLWGHYENINQYQYSYYIHYNDCENLMNYMTYNIPNNLIEGKKLKIEICKILEIRNNNNIFKKLVYKRIVEYEHKENLLNLLNSLGRPINI